MLTVQHFLIAARELLTKGQPAPELCFSGGPQLHHNGFSHLSQVASQANLDIVYLEFGERLQDGPERFQIVFPRANIVHVRLAGTLWSPKGDGPCAIVSGNRMASYLKYDDGELAHFGGRITADAQSGIRRARKRLIAHARSASINGTENNTRVVVRG